MSPTLTAVWVPQRGSRQSCLVPSENSGRKRCEGRKPGVPQAGRQRHPGYIPLLESRNGYLSPTASDHHTVCVIPHCLCLCLKWAQMDICVSGNKTVGHSDDIVRLAANLVGLGEESPAICLLRAGRGWPEDSCEGQPLLQAGSSLQHSVRRSMQPHITQHEAWLVGMGLSACVCVKAEGRPQPRCPYQSLPLCKATWVPPVLLARSLKWEES